MFECMYASMKDIFCVSEYLLQEVSAMPECDCQLAVVGEHEGMRMMSRDATSQGCSVHRAESNMFCDTLCAESVI